MSGEAVTAADDVAATARSDFFRRELARAIDEMAAAVAAAPGDAPVPACPEWDVTNLVEHLVAVHRWAAAVVLTGSRQSDEIAVHAPTGDLAGWYARAGGALLAALGVVDPADPAWNFTGADQTAAFWWRRQLHEVTVHRVDVQLAGGAGQPVPPPGRGLAAPRVDPQVAADGVDEVLGVWPRRMARRRSPVVVTEPIAVTTTDTGHRWVLEPAEPHPTVRRDAGSAGAAARVGGAAAALYLRLWNRADGSGLQVHGEAPRAFLAGPRVP